MAHKAGTEQILYLPQEPVQRLLKPLIRFLHVEAASGIFLALCALLALLMANSPWSSDYLAIWKLPMGISIGDFQLVHSLKHWINDGLMAIFFFVIGLEVKREIVVGELRELRRAALPISAALGGMLVPAGLYFALQVGQPGQNGWGVPMATDIAFVVGCMAILGSRVPAALRVLLLSLAIVDDIGAILVIAIGYTDTIHLSWLFTGLSGIGVVFFMQRIGVRSMLLYTLLGFLIWVGFHQSGIHATIAGVVIGLMTPARPYLKNNVAVELFAGASRLLHGDSWENELHRPEKVITYQRVSRETISPVEYLIYLLHPWVAFLIMPVFALANAGVAFQMADVATSTAMAVIIGLLLGKPLGILLFSWLAVKSGIAQLPTSVNWKQLTAGGFLAGIGFTMALFIAGLAFKDESLLRTVKVGVLLGSFLSAVVGMSILGASAPETETEQTT
ncbi:Na+/H+ antiporter NhaA [Gimesia sp.]|uniref:Na+/H+ antiporter NhaA n=1 Tax=Gimesia sp. TaxID=2024833 RepID=UPI003A900898